MVVVAHAPGPVSEEEEAHHLHHPLAAAAVPVLHVAELLHELAPHAGLLADLALGGLGGALAGVDVALGQRKHGAVLHPHRRRVLASAEAPHADPSGRELPDHRPSSASASSGTRGTKRTGTTRSARPSRKRIRSSPWACLTGHTSAAPGASWSISSRGGSPVAAAVTEMPPNGARSGAPAAPSPTLTSTLS